LTEEWLHVRRSDSLSGSLPGVASINCGQSTGDARMALAGIHSTPGFFLEFVVIYF